MITIRKRISSLLLIIMLLCSAILNGCQPKQAAPAATTAAPFAERGADAQKSPDKNKHAAQKEFDQITTEFFRDLVGSNRLDLHFLIKDPDAYGVDEAPSLYGTISLDGMVRENNELMELKLRLDGIDLNLLTNSQKLTLRILQSHLRTAEKSYGLEQYYQPLSNTIGTQAQLPILLSEYTFYNRQDVEEYLELLGGIDEYYAEILVYEQELAEAGMMMPDHAIDNVITSCESYLLVPGNNFMIDTFQSRLDAVDGLTEEEKQAYTEQNAALLESDFVPAYQLLIDGMTALKGTCTYEGGMSNTPEGKKYYEYLVYANTGTSYSSVEEMLIAMEACLNQNLIEITTIGRKNPQLLELVDNYQFRQTEPEAMIEELKQLTQKDFPSLPECNYTLKIVPKALESTLSPAFYLTPPIDDYKNNTIFINQNERFDKNTYYTTLAHEGYPGHLYQSVYFRARCDDPLRQILPAVGYKEGWATYVEQYSYTLDNGLDPELGKLLAANMIATLGLQACLDVYINYMGWTEEQVADYLSNYYSNPEPLAAAIYQSMTENPTNFLSYYVGYIEFDNMKTLAEKQLGNNFDLKEFHTFLLDIGPAPFDVIQPYFSSWLGLQK
ncbi:MAG: DUF885 domain-containing protein [Lachnospiraceae bacterium]